MKFLPKSIFTTRYSKIKEYLAANGLEALVVLTPDNFYFVSNFFLDVAPWERPVAAVLPLNSEPFLVMNELSQNHVRMAQDIGMLWINDWTYYVEHPRQVNRRWTTPQWTALLAEKLEERGIVRGMLGVDGSIASIQTVKNYLPKLNFENATPMLIKLRRVKCEQELDFLRWGAQIADFGQERFRENVRPGRYLTEVDAETWLAMTVEAAKRFPDEQVEISRFHSWNGPASAAPHGSPGAFGRKIAKGDIIINLPCLRFNGIAVENERTWIVDAPASEIVVKAFNAATAATLAGVEAAVTGNPVSAIDAAAQKVIEDAGFGDNIIHRTGHGMGIAGHGFPEDMPFNCRPLETNEIYSVEPGIYIHGLGGFRHDDSVIIKPGKAENVTGTPKTLKEQTIPV